MSSQATQATSAAQRPKTDHDARVPDPVQTNAIPERPQTQAGDDPNGRGRKARPNSAHARQVDDAWDKRTSGL